MDNFDQLITRLDDHIRESDRRHNETTEILKDYKIMINSKASKETFMWIIGILIMILIGMFGYIAYRLDTQNQSITSIQQDTAYLKGKLAPYDVQYKN